MIYIHCKMSPISPHTLKGRSARKKPLLQNRHKKARQRFATAHGDKDHTFWRNRPWSDETKIELLGHNDHLCLEDKGGGLQAEEHHPNCEARGWQHHVVGVLCCRRDWCTSQIDGIMREENDVDILKQHQDISQEVKAWLQMGLSNGQ
jgi:hypothetical protein